MGKGEGWHSNRPVDENVVATATPALRVHLWASAQHMVPYRGDWAAAVQIVLIDY